MLCPILAFVDMVCAFPDSCRYHVQGVAEWCVYLSVCVCVCVRGRLDQMEKQEIRILALFTLAALRAFGLLFCT